MYTILSPSKTQDFFRNVTTLPKGLCKVSEWNEQTKELVKVMKEFSMGELGKMMKISPKLAQLNFERFQDWDGEYGSESTHAPALLVFLGDVYKRFALEGWGSAEYVYAHKHLGIVSGFYGLISPLDYIQPYRLEMGTKIRFIVKNLTHGNDNSFMYSNRSLHSTPVPYKNLYHFWSDRLTEKMFQILKTEKILINLASVEYSKVIDRKILKQKQIDNWRGGDVRVEVQIIDIDFKIKKPNKKTGKIEEKIIAIYAKRARGLMANWIVEKRTDTPKDLQRFTCDGWKFKEVSVPDMLGNVRMLFVKTL